MHQEAEWIRIVGQRLRYLALRSQFLHRLDDTLATREWVIASLHTSFGEEPTATLRILGEDGWILLHNAYLHDAPVTLEMLRRGRREEVAFEPTDQFAAELSYFSTCILQDRPPEPSGIEGLQDVRLVEAIYRSSRDGRPVTLPRLARPEAVPAAEADLRKALVDRRQAG